MRGHVHCTDWDSVESSLRAAGFDRSVGAIKAHYAKI